MGIKGLLPFLKKATRPANVEEFKGGVVAVDTYCWLHKGAFACAEKLALGENTDQYVQYCMKYVNVLLSFDIKPIMVFDGCRLPSKKEVEKARREQRNANRKKASQLLMEGKMSEARDCLVKCIDVTPEMALNLINACRERGVDCIVAPYEADAQLAYLNKIGIVDLVITEDSDLTLFGCDKILFKMDITGNGQLVERSKIPLAIDLTEDQYTFEKFRRICILSGCDYLANLPGIGLAKATKVFKLSKQTVIKQLIRKIPVLLKMSSLSVPEEYIENFIKAENTFLYQLVYDPLQRKVVPLNPYPPGIDLACLRYAGPPLSEEMGFQIAIGNININTGEKMANFDPDTFKPKMKDFNIEGILKKSIWSTNSKILDDEDMKSPSILKRRDKTTKRTGSMGKSMTVIDQNQGRVNSHRNKNSEFNKDESIIHIKELAKMYSSGKNEVLLEHVKDEDTEDESEDVVVHKKLSNKNTTPHSPKDGGDKKNEASPFISPSKMNLFAVQKSEERKSNGKKRFSIDGNSETPKSEKSNCRFFVASPEPLRQSKFFVQLKQIDSECNKNDDDDDDIVDSISDAEMKSNSFNQPKGGSEFRSKLSAFACRYKKSGDLISKGTSMVTHKSSKRNLFSMDDVVDLTIESETGSASKKLRLDALIDRSDMNGNDVEFGREFKGTRRSIFGISRDENAVKRANQAIDDLNFNLGDPLRDLTSKELNRSNNSHHIWQISPSKISSKSDEDPLSQITCKLTNKKKSLSSLDNDFYENEKVLSDEGESEDPLQSVQGSVGNKMKNKEKDNHGSKQSGLLSCGRPKKQQQNSSSKQSLLNFFTSNFSFDKKLQQFPSK